MLDDRALAECRQAPDVRTSDADGGGAERQRFEDVRAAPEAAVDEHRHGIGRTLDDFIKEPTGTMQVVLTRQIVLSPEEKAVAIGKLREAFAEHQKLKAGEAKLNPGQVIESRQQ